MSVGSYLKYAYKKGSFKYYIRGLLGTADFHSHIRLKPILKLCKQGYFRNQSVMEIGCGSGMIGFEFWKRMGVHFHYIGIDLSEENIEGANKIKKVLHTKNLEFVCEDAFAYLERIKEEKIDMVILYDFLEHITMPESFIKELTKKLNNPNLIYIISVPTHKYPKVFGQEFHKKVGHVVEGYSLEELKKLFCKIGKQPTRVSYNTGLWGNIGARILYCIGRKLPLVIREIITKPFLLLDINGSKISSSLFVVFDGESSFTNSSKTNHRILAISK